MKNTGKIFEDNWKASIPDYAFYYRFRDSATGWSNNGMTRFTITNIADCLIQDNFGLHLIELKSIKGKAIPLAKIIGNKAKEKQIKDLYNASAYNNVYCNIVVFFSDLERCFSITIDKFNDFIENETRKSIPVDWFEENGTEIKVRKLKTNYRFDIDSWLCSF